MSLWKPAYMLSHSKVSLSPLLTRGHALEYYNEKTLLFTGQEFTIPSPLLRFLAELVDFIILFCVKATIVLWIMHLSGMKWVKRSISLTARLFKNKMINHLRPCSSSVPSDVTNMLFFLCKGTLPDLLPTLLWRR